MNHVSDLTDDEISKPILQGLPAMFKQDADSNNRAILQTILDHRLVLWHTLQDIEKYRHLDNMQGTLLDEYGADWGVSRIDDDDDFMRFLIRLNQIKSTLGVTENDMIRLISYTLNIDPKRFTVESRRDVVGEPEAIKILNIPNEYNTDPRKTKMLEDFLQECVATEVRIAEIQFQSETTLKVYFGVTAQQHRQSDAPSNLFMNRTSHIYNRVYCGALTTCTRKSDAPLLTTENLKGVI